jgi:transposase, IS5 family
VCDRGYRGASEINGIAIAIPKPAKKKATRHQRDKIRHKFKRRAAIEPIIGHLKSHYRLARNYLKGSAGDAVNLLMAACAWNLRKWMMAYLEAIFCAIKIHRLAKNSGAITHFLSFWLFCRWLCVDFCASPAW